MLVFPLTSTLHGWSVSLPLPISLFSFYFRWLSCPKDWSPHHTSPTSCLIDNMHCAMVSAWGQDNTGWEEGREWTKWLYDLVSLGAIHKQTIIPFLLGMWCWYKQVNQSICAINMLSPFLLALMIVLLLWEWKLYSKSICPILQNATISTGSGGLWYSVGRQVVGVVMMMTRDFVLASLSQSARPAGSRRGISIGTSWGRHDVTPLEQSAHFVERLVNQRA